MAVERFIQLGREFGWLWRFIYDLLDELHLVQQVVAVKVDEVQMGGPRHQDAKAKKHHSRYQGVQKGESCGEGQAPDHQECSGTSST